jgi:hypothetical protein
VQSKNEQRMKTKETYTHYRKRANELLVEHTRCQIQKIKNAHCQD